MVASCPDVPSHCKAGVVKRHGKNFVLEVEKVPVPQPGTGQLLLKLNVTGICYSDVHYMLEDLPLPRMGDYGVKSPGHEGAGMVVAIGDGVTGWKIGDRAGVKPTWDTCMCCELCLSSLECHCAQAIPTGLKVPGTYQEYILSPAKYTTRIPVGVDDFCAGPIMCSGSTIYRSMVESGLRPGQWAAFIGAGGGVGHMGVQLAKAMGARVIGIDSGQDKQELCLELGCEAFIDFTASKDVAGDAVQLSDGEGAHAVFVTATSPAAYTLATKMARVGGKIMCVGMPPSGSAFAGDDPMFLILRNLKVIGTLTGSLRDTKEVLEFAARGLLRPVYETYSISQLPDAVAKLRAGQVRGRCVVDFNAVQAS